MPESSTPTASGPSFRNPALAPLEALVGDWVAEAVFPDDPPGAVRGRVSFAWLEGGAFLMMRSEVEEGGPPASTSVIGRDDATDGYTMLYFDERGVSRIYEMGFGDGVWTLRRNNPGFSQRFTGTFDAAGTKITASWEQSTDGSRWEHDFDLTYTKTA
jgi:hypothetical protein